MADLEERCWSHDDWAVQVHIVLDVFILVFIFSQKSRSNTRLLISSHFFLNTVMADAGLWLAHFECCSSRSHNLMIPENFWLQALPDQGFMWSSFVHQHVLNNVSKIYGWQGYSFNFISSSFYFSVPVFHLIFVLELWSWTKEGFLPSFSIPFFSVLFHLRPSTQAPSTCCISSVPDQKYNLTCFQAHNTETCSIRVPLFVDPSPWAYSALDSQLNSFLSSLAFGHYSFT